MGSLKVGAFLSSFRLGFAGGLKKAREIGLDGIELSSIEGELNLGDLSPTGRKEVRRKIEEHGLEISSICGDLGGTHYTEEADIEEKIEKTRYIMDLCLDMGTNIVQTHIGVMPEDSNSKVWKTMSCAMDKLGEYGERIGVYLATETGPESPELMKRFLDSVGRGKICVNYDPANLIFNGYDYLGGVGVLRDYIVHTHAKDGRAVADEKGRKEQPLGEGEVNFPEYLKALDRIGFKGYFVIEREVGENPAGDIEKAAKFLRQF